MHYDIYIYIYIYIILVEVLGSQSLVRDLSPLSSCATSAIRRSFVCPHRCALASQMF